MEVFNVYDFYIFIKMLQFSNFLFYVTHVLVSHASINTYTCISTEHDLSIENHHSLSNHAMSV